VTRNFTTKPEPQPSANPASTALNVWTKSAASVGIACSGLLALIGFSPWGEGGLGIAVGRREADIYRRGHPGEPTPLAWLVTLGGTLVGASAGAWIDNLIEGREIMYQNPGHTLAVKVAPAVVLTGSKRLGLAGSITWR